MTHQEFDDLMQIVYSRWTARAYPDSLKSRIWFFCKDLPQKSFEKIIYTLLDTERTAPMPRAFQLLANAEKDRLGLRETKEPETKPSREAKCQDCGDSGNLSIARKPEHEAWAKWEKGIIRCHCPKGSARPSSQGAQWNAAIARSYEKEPAYLGIKGDWRPKANMGLVRMVQEMREILGSDKKERRSKPGLTPANRVMRTPYKDDTNDDGPGAA